MEGLLCIIEETTERVGISAQLMQEGKMSAIGRLATAIAHELNNPLATLVAHAELACDLIPPSGRGGVTAAEFEELRGYLEVVQKQAFQCKEIIKNLFDLLWREGVEEGSIDINDLLDDIVGAKDFSERGVRVTRAFRTDLPLIKGDSRALRQVFMNITQNALDAMEARTEAEIRIKTEIDEECIRVEFEDNDPVFRRLSPTIFSSRSLPRRNRARAWARFDDLPRPHEKDGGRHRDAAAAGRRKHLQDKPPGRRGQGVSAMDKIRVLIVDDGVQLTQAFKKKLEQEGSPSVRSLRPRTFSPPEEADLRCGCARHQASRHGRD